MASSVARTRRRFCRLPVGRVSPGQRLLQDRQVALQLFRRQARDPFYRAPREVCELPPRPDRASHQFLRASGEFRFRRNPKPVLAAENFPRPVTRPAFTLSGYEFAKNFANLTTRSGSLSWASAGRSRSSWPGATVHWRSASHDTRADRHRRHDQRGNPHPAGHKRQPADARSAR